MKQGVSRDEGCPKNVVRHGRKLKFSQLCKILLPTEVSYASCHKSCRGHSLRRFHGFLAIRCHCVVELALHQLMKQVQNPGYFFTKSYILAAGFAAFIKPEFCEIATVVFLNYNRKRNFVLNQFLVGRPKFYWYHFTMGLKRNFALKPWRIT